MGKPTLFVAAGHGGPPGDWDAGNTSGTEDEADVVIRVVNQIVSFWKALGIAQDYGGFVMVPHTLALKGEIPAILSHQPDKNDLALDIHLNWKGAAKPGGAMVIVDPETMTRNWASAFLKDWSRISGINNDGVFDSKVAATWRTDAAGRPWKDMGFCAARFPGAIVEIGCLNSAGDMRVVNNPAMIEALATLIWMNWLYVRPNIGLGTKV